MYCSGKFEAETLEELQSKIIESCEEKGLCCVPYSEIEYIMEYETGYHFNDKEVVEFLNSCDEVMSNNKKQILGEMSQVEKMRWLYGF